MMLRLKMEPGRFVPFWEFHMAQATAWLSLQTSLASGEIRCYDCKKLFLMKNELSFPENQTRVIDIDTSLVQDVSTTPSESSDSSDDVYIPPVKVHTSKKIKKTRSKRKTPSKAVKDPASEKLPDKLLRCLLCPRRYKRNYDLARHMRAHHSDIKSEPTDTDNNEGLSRVAGNSSNVGGENCFGNETSAQNLKSVNHDEVTCNNCKRKFHTKEALQRHVTGDRCIMNPLIDEKESSMDVLVEEQQDYADDPRLSDDSESSEEEPPVEKRQTRPSKEKPPYKCEVCKKQFKLKESYTTHSRIHTGEKPYTCHMCGKQFSHSGGLSYHLRHVHMGIKEHACDICGRSFALKAAMEDHRRIHTGERPYICDACGKSFKSKASLYIHSKTHTDNFPHPCEYCQKRFRWRQQLLGHLTTHTGEKKHHCKVCGKGFGVRNDLTRHERIHSNVKPFKCQVCSLPFGQKRYLKNHLKSRHGIHEIPNLEETHL